MAELKARSDKARPDKTGPWEPDQSGRLRRALEIKGTQYIQWDSEKGPVVKRGPSTTVQPQSIPRSQRPAPTPDLPNYSYSLSTDPSPLVRQSIGQSAPYSLFPRSSTEGIPHNDAARPNIEESLTRSGPNERGKSYRENRYRDREVEIIPATTKRPAPVRVVSAPQPSMSAPETNRADPPSYLSPLGREFIKIKEREYGTCENFMCNNPEIFKEKLANFQLEAVRLIREGKSSMVRTCVQQLLLLRKCSSMSDRDCGIFFSRMREGDQATLINFLGDFDTTLKAVKAKSDLEERSSQPKPFPSISRELRHAPAEIRQTRHGSVHSDLPLSQIANSRSQAINMSFGLPSESPAGQHDSKQMLQDWRHPMSTAPDNPYRDLEATSESRLVISSSVQASLLQPKHVGANTTSKHKDYGQVVASARTANQIQGPAAIPLPLRRAWKAPGSLLGLKEIPYQDSDESDLESASSSPAAEPESTFGRNRNRSLQAQQSWNQFARREPDARREPEALDQNQIIHPRAYYSRLQDLKEQVYKSSGLAALRKSSSSKFIGTDSSYRLQVPNISRNAIEELGWTAEAEDILGLCWPDEAGDEEILGHCAELLILRKVQPPGATSLSILKTLRSILVSRNIINLVSANLWRLRSFGFIQHQISLLLANDDRPNVARLVSIRIAQVKETVQMFSSTISRILEAVRFTVPNEELLREITSDLATKCTSILRTIGFQSTVNNHGWRTTAHVLDLAVLSYVSAHIENFDVQILGNTREIFRIPGDLYPNTPHDITLRRYPISCLDEFLKGEKIWAFREASLQVMNPQPPLYVSTNIDDFADIWGPVWRVHCDESPDSKIQRYDVGGGCIVPRFHEKGLHPKLVGDERLCHWSSRRQSSQSTDKPLDQSLQSAEFTFTGQERLLIGARQRRHHMEWSSCRCNIQDLEDHLRGLNRLQQLRTNRPYAYVDSRAVSLVGGSNGLTLGGIATIKRVKGVSFKDVFFDRWEKEPETRHPRDLTHLWGVAVSMCTMNAERVSVFELLTIPSIGRLLERFQWSNSDRKDQYITAIETGDPNALCSLWEKQREWQEELGKVLLVCLQALYHTGFDGDRGEFTALWVSPGTNLPKRVLLKPSEHSWIKFLCDSEVSFTVAVLHEECLGAKFGRRQCGWSEGKSALQTSICINDEIDPRKQLLIRNAPPRASSKWERIWDVSQLSRGTRFLVGAQGRLKTIEVIKGSRLLLEWDLIWRDALREMVGLERQERQCHWEYTELVDVPIRPIPVYLQSSSG